MFESTKSFLAQGKPQWSSEQDIKKAYYKLAKETHPDMFQDPTQKEKATEAFRELHDEYENQIYLYRRFQCDPGSRSWKTAEPSDRPKKDNSKKKNTSSEEKTRATKTDSDIKRAFDKVANDLKKEKRERIKNSKQQAVEQILHLWPAKKEECWRTARSTFLLSDIRDLGIQLRKPEPDLSEFLLRRLQEERRAMDSRTRQKKSNRVDRINREWSTSPTAQASLERWAMNYWCTFDYDDIARRVSNPEAARAIRKWKARRSAELDRRRREMIKRVADGIVECNAEVNESRRLLESLLMSQYKDVYKLLPEDILHRLRGC